MKSESTNNWIVCRICLQQPSEEMQLIFDHNEDKDLTQAILQCGGVPIKRFDHYPDKICSKCLKYLRVAQKFRNVCQRSHQHLSKFLAPVVIDPVRLEDMVEADISLELDNVTLPFKLEPPEEVECEQAGQKIKQEIVNDDEEDIMDMYEPMTVDMDNEEVEKIDEGLSRALEETANDYEYLEDIDDDNVTSGAEFEVVHLNGPEKPIINAKELNKEPKKQKSSPTDPSLARTFRPNKIQLRKNREAAMENIRKATAAVSRNGRSNKKVPKKMQKETSFICDICGNIYPSQSRLTEHIKLHKGIKPHDCEICGHAFAQTQQLTRHMNTHTGNRPYKCNYCPAAFADLSTRNKHHRIHTNERPYVCDVCGKSFTYTNTLKFHKMIHTGEKPHVCDICGKGFQQAYKMRSHRQIHERKGQKMKLDTRAQSSEEIHVATEQILEI